MNTEITNSESSLKDSKPKLLVLHGWAMNASVWEFVREPLIARYDVQWVELPGHGKASVLEGEVTLDSWVDQVYQSVSEPCHILAWSLGGLVAQRLAQRFPESVLSLSLVAISPSFIQRDQWAEAVAPSVLQGFADNLRVDYKETIKRFVALQFLGVKNYRRAIKPWLDQLLSKPAKLVALKQGLAILATTDCREYNLVCPVLWVLGEKDKLVPQMVANDLLAIGANHSVKLIKGAGHAPFLSHVDEFIAVVSHFILNIEKVNDTK